MHTYKITLNDGTVIEIDAEEYTYLATVVPPTTLPPGWFAFTRPDPQRVVYAVDGTSVRSIETDPDHH